MNRWPRLVLLSALSTLAETWLDDVRPVELVVAGPWVYWTESKLKEFDDRDVSVLRAAVYRRRQEGGPRETLFEFRRDDTYCLPQNLNVHQGRVAWLCRRPILDGNGRADATRYMVWNDGVRREMSVPWALPNQVATSEHAVYVAQRGEITRLDLRTGKTRIVASLPDRRVQLVGVTRGQLVGMSAQRLWTLDGETVRDVFVAPDKHEIFDVVVSDTRIVVSSGVRGVHCSLTELRAGSEQLLLETRDVVNRLVEADDLFFVRRGSLYRLGHPAPFAEAAPPAQGLAVSTTHVYWLSSRTIMRISRN